MKKRRAAPQPARAQRAPHDPKSTRRWRAQPPTPDPLFFRGAPDPLFFNGADGPHRAQISYAFCAALQDTAAPDVPTPGEKAAIVKLVGESFDYCSTAIAHATEDQMNRTHSTPDGRLNGRELLLALYVHMAHHRGQAEVYLRVKGIKPPQYVF